jgi:tetratricopeptide (TPR) repeat protein
MLRAAKHVERAIDEQGSPTPGLLAMRGSINLALGNIFRAVEDFKEMLCLRESAGTSEREIADAQMQLGFAYSLCMLPRGRALLRASVHTLRKSPDDPNLARALRKLAFSYKLVGNFRRARKYQAEANSVAAGLAEYDQMNR